MAQTVRQLGTIDNLAIEAARLLHTHAQREAARLLAADAEAPTGNDLLDRLIRAYLLPAQAEQRAAQAERTRAALAAEFKEQERLRELAARKQKQ